jgi:hypothetical protein
LSSVSGMFLSVKDRQERADYALPFAVLFFIFLIQAARGLLTMQPRYALILGYLILPFSAEAFLRLRQKSWFPLLLICALMFAIPTSYTRVAIARLMGPAFPNFVPADLEAVPKVSRRAAKLAEKLPLSEMGRNGLILDFFNWKDTYYVALISRVRPERIWFMPGGKYQPFASSSFSRFAAGNPTGVLIRAGDSKYIAIENASGHAVARLPGDAPVLDLIPVETQDDLTIYRYATEKRP